LGPKAFVKLGSATLLEIALHTMLQISSKVIVALPVERLDEAKKGLSDPRILWIGGGPRRIDTLRLLVEHSQADWLVLHDVVHPFVTAELANEVLKAAYPSGAAAAALPLHEFLYDARGEQVARPGQAFSVQKPIAFRRSAIAEGFAKADRLGVSHDASALEILALAGVLPTFVEGFPWNQKITYEVDIEFSGALLSKLPKNTEFKI
jgi:2-C-methyl-D-erythritol 4-phosphate cytidylyltransferase